MADSIDVLLPPGTPTSEPGVARPREQLVWQFAQQARACGASGSPLYAGLLARAAGDVAAEGACWRLLADHVAPGRGRAVALRLMAAVHRLVLTGEAPALAAHYPSTGGEGTAEDAWTPFLGLVEERAETLAPLVVLPCQTNEVGRAAALAVGLLDVVARTGLPLAVRELGTAAGLNLRWDRFRYAGGGRSWGDPESPVDLAGLWVDVPVLDGVDVEVVSRLGVDRAPLDPTTAEGRLAVTASVWADQRDRLERLAGAIELAREVPAPVVLGDAVDWVERELAVQEGRATVVMQSVVREYLSEADRQRLARAVEAAGAEATPTAPLAWLRLEPISSIRRHGLVLTSWPGGRERFLVTAGALGSDVRRAEGPPPAATE